MQYKFFSKIILSSMLGVIILSLIISGCNIGATVTGITATPVTPSPTPRICLSNTDLNSLEDLSISHTFIVVLYDPFLATDHLELLNGQIASNALDFTETFLPKVLGPGDQYSIFSLGYRGYEAAKLDRYTSKILDAPKIVETPFLYSTLTPIPTPTQSDAVLANQVAKNQYVAAVDAQKATETQLAFEYNCEVMNYEDSYKVTATQWSVTKQAEANEISTQIGLAKEERGNTVSVLETPFVINNVYEGLSHVTVDFESQCKNYDRCILIIIDDLVDWRNAGPGNKIPDLPINLKGVDVIAVMPQCVDIIQPSCVNTQNLWTDEILAFGANTVEYHNGDDLEEFLVNFIGDK
ncbi:MAG: hypothetical protein HYZ25_05795 [Chloroflexi bacterium]|nr:hypothetical protein [Chloroflexota bacterium]